MKRLGVSLRPSSVLASIAFATTLVTAQTYSNCNPLFTSSCPPDSALGRDVDIDFTSGPSDSFTPQGDPTYDSNGVSFTVSQSGDNPQLNSRWYIMFGRVEAVIKAAPGAGIVSSCVLQSDVLDEIDWEWLGADPDSVQTNYFGKGLTTSYNRGAFHPDPGSQSDFKTYTIDWTADQITWQIDGTTVRVLTAAEAAENQYPQTPMQLKVGAWSGGDPANSQGTIEWAQGPTDYTQGPFTMQMKSLSVTDYSTGTEYVYEGNDGSWQSIVAVDGSVNPDGSDLADEPPPEPDMVSEAPGQPYPFVGVEGGGGGQAGDETEEIVRPDVYPWVPDPAASAEPAENTFENYPGMPSGWTVNAEGKVVQPNAGTSRKLKSAHFCF